MKTKSKVTAAVLALLLMLVMGTLLVPHSALAAKKIRLTYVTFVPKNFAGVIAFHEAFVERVNELAKGELVIEFRGGPEVFAANDIGDAVQSGAVDMGFVYVGAYESIVPGIGAYMLSQLEPEEERFKAYDYLEELHNQGGLHYVMRAISQTGNYFRTWLRKPVEKPQDLTDVLIGSATAGQPAVDAWGATWVNVAVADNFTALEQGVVDGIAGQPYDTAVAQSYYTVAKYSIDHPYYKCTVPLIMNLNRWNSLPDHLKKIFTEAAIGAETDIKKRTDKFHAEKRQFLIDNGHTFIKFSPADAEWYVQSAYNSAWELQRKRFPKVTPKLREVLSK